MYLIEAPRRTPCFQLLASRTRGMVVGLLPPNKIAEIGTPAGSSQAGSITGHCPLGVQNLLISHVKIRVRLTAAVTYVQINHFLALNERLIKSSNS